MKLGCAEIGNYQVAELLAIINSTLKGRATIGGGALRSYFEGDTPRDIDIFMLDDNEESFREVVDDVLHELNLAKYYPKKIVSKNDYFTEDYHCMACWGEYIWVCDIIVSFIVPKEYEGRVLYGTPEVLASEYDLSPVRCCLLPDNTIHFADGKEEYFKLFYAMDMKVRGDVQSQKRTQKRIEKYQKYGYRLIGEI